jgi:uncharacterized paraquat-inducible protein A
MKRFTDLAPKQRVRVRPNEVSVCEHCARIDPCCREGLCARCREALTFNPSRDYLAEALGASVRPDELEEAA